jgi:hypothetical protein
MDKLLKELREELQFIKEQDSSLSKVYIHLHYFSVIQILMIGYL